MAIELEPLRVRLEFVVDDVGKKMDKVLPRLNQMKERLNGTLNQVGLAAEKETQAVTKAVGQMANGVERQTKRTSSSFDEMMADIRGKAEQAKALSAKASQMVNGDESGDKVAKVQANAEKYRAQSSAMAGGLLADLDKAPEQLQELEKELDSTGNDADFLRDRMKQLKEQFDRTGSDKDFKAYASAKSKFESLRNVIDKLSARYEALDERMKNVSKHASELKTIAGQGNKPVGSATASTGRQTSVTNIGGRSSNQIAHGNSRLGNSFDYLKQKMNGVKSMLPSMNNSLGNSARRTSQMSNNTGELGRQLKQLPAQFLVYGLLFMGLQKMTQGLWATLKANDQFSASLNQIKANLMTAFYPIYQAVMPAINALMQGLATVTGYLAAFIATLFGTSVSAAQAGAQGLADSAGAILDNGSAADNTTKKVKKLQQTLAGFDQINTLQSPTDDESDADSGNGGAGGIDWGAVQTPSTPKWLTDFTKAFKEEMAKLFDPIKQAWDAKGKAVMDAWKYATDQVWQAVKNVAGSFEEVWTNGTGEKTMKQLFQLLANILNIIGDIGAAFNKAWTNGGAGTKMIQSWFDALNKVLGAVNDIAQSWRDAWNNGNGETLFTHLISIGTNLANIIGGFAGQFDKAWKSGGNGTKIFDSLMGLANDFWGMVDDITGSLAKWATNLNLVPLMTSLSKAIGGIRDAFQPIWDLVTKIFTNTLLPAFKALIENLLPPILDLIGNLGDLFSALYKPLSPLVDWLTKAFGAAIQQNFKDAGKFAQAFSDVVGGIADIVKKVVSGFSDFFTNVGNGFDDFKASIKKKWDEIIGWFGDLKNNTFEGVVNLKHKAVDTVQTAWNGVISIVNKMKTAFNNAWTKTKERTIAVYNRLKKAFNGVWNKTVNRTIAVYNRLKKAFNSRWAKTVNRTIAVYNRLKNTVKTAWKGTLSLASKVTGFAKAIRDAFASAGGKIAKFFGFKKGTQNFAGGMALVNDAGNANWRESYQEPGGPIKLLPNQKNLVTTFRRGTKIFTGEQTKRMQAKGILPKFASGIGNGQMDDLLGLLDKFANIGNLAVPNLPTPQLSMAGVGTQQVEVADQQGFANTIATAIVTALQAANGKNDGQPINVTIEMDKQTLGKASVKAINYNTKLTGKSGLKV